MLAELDEVKAELKEAKATIQQLKELQAAALATIERLTEELKKNSSNSHRPPSSDGPGAASRGVRSSKKSKSKRKRGGQKGRRGARRQLLSPQDVDVVIDVFPEACEGCARSLPQILDVAPRRYQCVDLLEGGRQVTEWRRHAVTCRCGRSTLAPYDRQQVPASPFGPRLVSVAAALTGVYHLSRRNTQSLLREVFGIRVSLGALSRMEARVSEALAAPSKEAHDDVLSAAVKHTDATTWLFAGLTMSLWTLSTSLTTVFRIFEDGARSTIEGMFGDDNGTQTGIMVSDRASVFVSGP